LQAGILQKTRGGRLRFCGEFDWNLNVAVLRKVDDDGTKTVEDLRALHKELQYLTGDALNDAIEASAEFIAACARRKN
jgi:hypothetical protein